MKKDHLCMWNMFHGPTWYNALWDTKHRHDSQQVEYKVEYNGAWVPFPYTPHMLRNRGQEQFSSVKVDR